MSSPTYGTGKDSTTQLAEDLTGAFSIAPKKRNHIDYEPRPDLVRPKSGENLALPQPQEKLASADNPQWPEGPEKKRERLKAEIDANRDNPAYDSPIVGEQAKYSTGRGTVPRDAGEPYWAAGGTSPDRRAEINRRLTENKQGDPTKRKYLSDPPLTYREPAATAASDDIGEDELKKERRRKREAQKKTDWSWRNLLPGG